MSDYHAPKTVLSTASVLVLDDFLPETDAQTLFEHTAQLDYRHINTTGAIRRVWQLQDGFPLRTMQNLYYFADPATKKQTKSVYPSKTPWDHFVRAILGALPMVDDRIGEPRVTWDHFSVSGWIYPPGTGLSLHDDGGDPYSGAYVYFLNPFWRIHWGGLLLVMDDDANAAILQKREQTHNTFHRKKWLHLSEHEELAVEKGIAHCIMPKYNRLVFISQGTYHMVTQVLPSCGDHIRLSLAGFFAREALR